MFEKVEVPVLGIVGKHEHAYPAATAGTTSLSSAPAARKNWPKRYHTQLLGQLPLHITLREDLDNGTPTVVARPDSAFPTEHLPPAGGPGGGSDVLAGEK